MGCNVGVEVSEVDGGGGLRLYRKEGERWFGLDGWRGGGEKQVHETRIS